MKTNPAGLTLISKIKSPSIPICDAECCVQNAVTVPLNPNQLAALVCFVSCRGPHAFLRSVLLKRMNAGQPFLAAAEFHRWNRQGGKRRRYLLLRRKAEKDLFLRPVIVSMNGG